jgi:hypothetical protein
MVTPAYNPGTREAEAGGPQIQGQPGLHRETLSKKKKKKKELDTVAHANNPSYSTGKDQEDHGLRSAKSE